MAAAYAPLTNYGARADHSDRDSNQELPLIEPTVLLHQSLLQERYDYQTAAECQRARLEKEQQELAQRRARRHRHELREYRHRCYLQCRRRRTTKEAAVVQDADSTGADEQQRHFGLEHHCDNEADRRNCPLQPIFHPELRQAVTGVQDERDDRRTHAIEHRGNRLEVAEVDVERTQGRYYYKIREDEGPSARPGTPGPSSQIGDINADLDRERSRQRLADRDRLAHLFFGEPFPFGDEFAFHLTDQSHWPAEPKPEPLSTLSWYAPTTA